MRLPMDCQSVARVRKKKDNALGLSLVAILHRLMKTDIASLEGTGNREILHGFFSFLFPFGERASIFYFSLGHVFEDAVWLPKIGRVQSPPSLLKEQPFGHLLVAKL